MTINATIESIAGYLTPTTLAAIITDLGDDQPSAVRAFRHQLHCLIGEDEAEELLNPTLGCDGCGCGSAKLGGNCDHCGEVIECDSRG